MKSGDGIFLLSTAVVCFVTATIVMMRAAMDLKKKTGVLHLHQFLFGIRFFLLCTSIFQDSNRHSCHDARHGPKINNFLYCFWWHGNGVCLCAASLLLCSAWNFK